MGPWLRTLWREKLKKKKKKKEKVPPRTSCRSGRSLQLSRDVSFLTWPPQRRRRVGGPVISTKLRFKPSLRTPPELRFRANARRPSCVPSLCAPGILFLCACGILALLQLLFCFQLLFGAKGFHGYICQNNVTCFHYIVNARSPDHPYSWVDLLII